MEVAFATHDAYAPPLNIIRYGERPGITASLHEAIADAGLSASIESAGDADKLSQRIGDVVDLIIVDREVGDGAWTEAIELVRARQLDLPVIVLDHGIRSPDSLECLRRGAADIVYADDLARLPLSVYTAIRERELRRQKLRAEQALEQVESFNKGVMASLSQNVAVIDNAGVIQAANRAWYAFGKANGASDQATFAVGANYVEVCEKADFGGDDAAGRALAGIREVLAGGRARFQFEYACHSPDEQRWYQMTVTPLDGGGGAVILHECITEQKRAQSIVAESEARFRALIQGAPDALLVYSVSGDGVGTVTEVNVSAERLFGRSREDLLASEPADLLGADLVGIDEIFRVVAEQDHGSFEVLLRTPHGDRIPGEVRASRFRWDGADQVIIHIRDISHRKATEGALRESAEMLKLAQIATNDLIWDYCFESDCIRWSGKMEELFGWENVSESSFAWWRERVHPEDVVRVMATLDEAMKQGSPVWQEEYRFLRADGTYAYVFDRGYHIPDSMSSRRRMAGAILDITRQKQSELVLRHNEELLRLATAAGRVGIYEMDPETDLVDLSPHAREILGIESERPLRWADLLSRVHPEDRVIVRAVIDRLKETGQVEVDGIEIRFTPAGGAQRWLLIKGDAVRMTYSDNGAAKLSGILMDITDRKIHEFALVEAQREAEDAARLKASLLVNMSHELRTPLTAIIGFADVLVELVQGEGREFANHISLSAMRLQETLDSVIELSRLEGSSEAPRFEPVDLADCALEVVDRYRARASRKGLEVHLNCLPAVAVADRSSVVRVIESLVSNAIKFTDEGEIRVDVRSRDGYGEIRVSDTGIGIGQEFMPRLFDAFAHEADVEEKTREGVGLGLHLSKRLVDLMGGLILVDSAPGAGARFLVRFELAAQA